MAGEAARRPGVLLRALCRPAREIPGLCCVSEAGAAARRGPARAPLSRASTHANTHANTHPNTPVNSPQLDQWHSPFGSRIGQGPSHLPGQGSVDIQSGPGPDVGVGHNHHSFLRTMAWFISPKVRTAFRMLPGDLEALSDNVHRCSRSRRTRSASNRPLICRLELHTGEGIDAKVAPQCLGQPHLPLGTSPGLHRRSPNVRILESNYRCPA